MDLSKAYDRIKWSFVQLVLKEAGIPDKLCDITIACITSVQTNVMWIGNQSDFFHPRRGLRQGDLLSPYIFVLCMDKLSHLISHTVSVGSWKPIWAGTRGPWVSHLMFADDRLLFGQANANQMQCMLDILKDFGDMFGQQVSIDKTSMIFSKGVTHKVRTNLVNISGFQGSRKP